MPSHDVLSHAIFGHLQDYLPWVSDIRGRIERMFVGGGWVFAAGRGRLSDPSSTLHRRSDYGVVRMGGYISIDTGKYSTAPWLARYLADRLV
jgi:hypothetical protein